MMMHQVLKLAKMKVSTAIATGILNTNLHSLLRNLSAAATTDTTTKSAAAQPQTASKAYIIRKIHEVGSTGGKVSDALHGIIKKGQQVNTVTLFDCFQDLRKKGRYQQCLEIVEWIEKGKFDSSGRNFTLRIDILHKLKGLAEAEKYFDGIPSAFKNQYVYKSLLSCYCADLETDKALATFKKMNEMGFASHVLTFNYVLNLYLKIKQPEKVPELISEMKKKQVPLDSHTYSYWIRSYQLLGDLEGVEQVFHEAQEDISVKDDWLIYSNVASVFIEFGQFEKAFSYLKILENISNSSDNPSRSVLEHLISLYARAGKLDSVIQSWNTLKSKFKVIYNHSYLTLLQALSRLDDIKGLENYFREWESSCKNYDDRVPAIPIGAYLRHDMLEEANVLLNDAKKKSGNLLCFPHVEFMNYYFGKGQTECALEHMEAAIVSKWKPMAEKLDPCFQHFKDQKDVDGLEKFCLLLKKAQALDTKSYLWLLQTYVDAEKTAPDMRERIEEGGIDVTPELEELLEQVCPNRF
ncbi:pentatricopeptide repeat-containing protein At4g01990, mitochondrial-like [Silene latifolia]|uniref:pentatricopeptide repeat-containing protein At4g01990, mitochondrial-like n=1 Tax=Silene latifolia TaxID=37657 RepID=UPI003D77D08B